MSTTTASLRLLESLKAKGGGRQMAVILPGLDPETARVVWNSAVDIAIRAIRGGRSINAAVASAMAHLHAKSEGFDEASAKIELLEAIAGGGSPAASGRSSPAQPAASPSSPVPSAPASTSGGRASANALKLKWALIILGPLSVGIALGLWLAFPIASRQADAQHATPSRYTMQVVGAGMGSVVFRMDTQTGQVVFFPFAMFLETNVV